MPLHTDYKEEYRHFRDKEKKLIATLCKLTKITNGEIGFGLSICSDTDNFSRKIGREVSMHRAHKAFLSKRLTLPIRIRSECLNIANILVNTDLIKTIGVPYKSIYYKQNITQ